MNKWNQVKIFRFWLSCFKRGKEDSYLNPLPLRTSCAKRSELMTGCFGSMCLETYRNSVWSLATTSPSNYVVMVNEYARIWGSGWGEQAWHLIFWVKLMITALSVPSESLPWPLLLPASHLICRHRKLQITAANRMKAEMHPSNGGRG